MRVTPMPSNRPARLTLLLALFLATALAALARGGLASPGTERPPLLDNRFIALPEADLFVASGRPDENFEGFGTMRVGYDRSGPFTKQRSLLRFDSLPTIAPGSQLTATLSLIVAASSPMASPMPVDVYRLNAPWERGTLTWNQHVPLVDGSTQFGRALVGEAAGQTVRWDVSDLVRYWLATPQSNHGLILIGDESPGDHKRAFWTTECDDSECGGSWSYPTLTIEWNEPPTPTPPALALRLLNQPAWQVAAAEHITYTLAFSNNSSAPLTGIVLTASVPLNTSYVPGSASHEGSHDPNSGQVTWTLTEPLSPRQGSTVSYRVVVDGAAPTATPTVTGPTATPLPSGSATPTVSGPTVTPPPPATATPTVTGPTVTPSPTVTQTPSPSMTPGPSPTPPPGDVDLVRLEGPLALTLPLNRTSPPITGLVGELGVTTLPGPGTGILGQVGYGPDGSPPWSTPGWRWFPVTYVADVPLLYDRYTGTLTPSEVGTFDYVYRFSLDGGTTWTYGDGDTLGNQNGYNPAAAGQLTVIPARSVAARPAAVQDFLCARALVIEARAAARSDQTGPVPQALARNNDCRLVLPVIRR